MSASSNTFQEGLNTIIERVVTDHPFHSLYQIFALGNGERVISSVKTKGKLSVDQDKIKAAKSTFI